MQKDSKYKSINDTLSAIGKATFVKYYYDFKNRDLSTEELSRKIAETNPNSKSTSQGFRIPRAKYIFENHQEIDALKIIIKSERVDQDARKRARDILDEELAYKESVNIIDISDEKSFINELNDEFDEQAEYEDVEITSRPVKVVSVNKYHRDKKVAIKALKRANYQCEVDSSHRLFKRKNSEYDYTEPHHLIPLSAAKDFPNINLDREENIVSLCSHCHNLLHYGEENEEVLELLYNSRKKLLNKIGINIEFEEFIKYYK